MAAFTPKTPVGLAKAQELGLPVLMIGLDEEDTAPPTQFCFFCGGLIHPLFVSMMWATVDDSFWLVAKHDFCP